MSAATACPAPPGPGSPRRIDDVVDSPDDLARWDLLADQLRWLRDSIEEFYCRIDRSAENHQKTHKFLMISAATFGTLAVLSAIVQLAGLPVDWTELASAVLAGAAVLFGLLAAFQKKWLYSRHFAERCRLEKYAYLCDPKAWCGDPAGARGTHRDRFGRLSALARLHSKEKMHALEEWSQQTALCEHPDVAPEACEPEILRQLGGYYLEKRLGFQLAFFKKRSTEYTPIEWVLRHIIPLCFGLSVLVVLLHFLGEKLEIRSKVVLTILTVVAAALPVVGSAFRTVRSAREFGRNRFRYLAAHQALSNLKVAIEKDLAEGNPSNIFAHFRQCERVLEQEHREWLRLMIDAEWFG